MLKATRTDYKLKEEEVSGSPRVDLSHKLLQQLGFGVLDVKERGSVSLSEIQ